MKPDKGISGHTEGEGERERAGAGAGDEPKARRASNIGFTRYALSA